MSYRKLTSAWWNFTNNIWTSHMNYWENTCSNKNMKPHRRRGPRCVVDRLPRLSTFARVYHLGGWPFRPFFSAAEGDGRYPDGLACGVLGSKVSDQQIANSGLTSLYLPAACLKWTTMPWTLWALHGRLSNPLKLNLVGTNKSEQL